MKIELSQLLPILIIAGGVIFGYAQLTSKVDAYEEYDDTDILRLADDNMNKIIALEVKMDMAEKLLIEYNRSNNQAQQKGDF